MEKDQEFVEMIVRNIVNNPEDVSTTREIDERGVLITLTVNPSDMGYVIGRQGNTARSIRTLLKIVGAKANAIVNLKINEPEGGRPPRVERTNRPERVESPRVEVPKAPAVEEEIDTSAVEDLNI
ncbi:MAG: KH domain-containing protein [Candidatus Magasanikbacteria bacterium]|nr:KH domain-containing protein [Candidatus Magasanikbacteria bacterium]